MLKPNPRCKYAARAVEMKMAAALDPDAGAPQLDDGEDPGDEAEDRGEDGHGVRPGQRVVVAQLLHRVDDEPNQHEQHCNAPSTRDVIDLCVNFNVYSRHITYFIYKRACNKEYTGYWFILD